MGKNKKKSRAHSDFAPQKRKPGKVLKKTNVTDTTFKTKKVSLITQLENSSNDPLKAGESLKPKLSVSEICQSLNHYQEPILRRALESLLELHTKDVNTFNENLHKIVPSVGRLLSIDTILHDSFIFCLNKVFAKIFSSPNHYIAALFDRICSYVSLGLTNVQDKMKIISLSIMHKYIFPQKNAAMNREIFKSYLRLIACDCVTGKVKVEVIRSGLSILPDFLKMYTRNNSESVCEYVEAEIKNGEMRIIQHTPPNIHYYELSLDPTMQMDSPFLYPTASKKGLAILADAVFVFLGRVLTFDNFPLDALINRLLQALKQFIQIFRGFVTEHGIRPGFFGEKLIAAAIKLKVMEPASRIKEVKVYFDELQKV